MKRPSAAVPVRVRLIVLGTMITLAVAGSFASVAQAATYTSYSSSPASEYQVRSSGSLTPISGGRGSVDFDLQGVTLRVTIETYRPAPGYQTIFLARGDGSVSFTHQSASNARQKCWWYFAWSPGVDGEAGLHCAARR